MMARSPGMFLVRVLLLTPLSQAFAYSCYESSDEPSGTVVDCQGLTLCHFRAKYMDDGVSQTSWRRNCELAADANKDIVNQVQQWNEHPARIIEYFCNTSNCNEIEPVSVCSGASAPNCCTNGSRCTYSVLDPQFHVAKDSGPKALGMAIIPSLITTSAVITVLMMFAL